MMKELISMTEYVLQMSKPYDKETAESETCLAEKFYDRVPLYANFLKRKLELWMFIPCDENGEPLKEPISIYYNPEFGCQKFPQECYESDLQQYQKAKERVLFEIDITGLDSIKHHISVGRDIEYLTQFKGIKLTKQALRLIEL